MGYLVIGVVCIILYFIEKIALLIKGVPTNAVRDAMTVISVIGGVTGSSS